MRCAGAPGGSRRWQQQVRPEVASGRASPREINQEEGESRKEVKKGGGTCCRGESGRDGMPGPLIHSPTHPRPHLQRNPGGVGLPGSPALPPWHSAAGRVVRRRDGKGLGLLTPKNIRPQFEPCQGSERAIFIRVLTK